MECVEEVTLSSLPIDRFAAVLGDARVAEVRERAASAERRLRGRALWHVNSTSRGGGVAEMLQSLLAYARGLGIDTRWLVAFGTPPFFQITKRLHHALHGAAGDGSPLGPAERAIYEEVLAANAAEMVRRVRPGDVVLLHDPQTAGLAPALVRHGATVMWRCHIGADTQNEHTELGWELIAPYLRDVAATVFSRAAYVPAALDAGRALVIAPSIDAFSPKNQHLDEATVRAILVQADLVKGPAGAGVPVFQRDDGSPGRVSRQADVIRQGSASLWDKPLVVQVSRWDPLKDPVGVVRGFAALLEGPDPIDADLVLAGPNVTAVTDDPEGAATLRATADAWRHLPIAARARIHLASLPMMDREENAAIVNALQSHASVIVQKSLREGFGLTVTEAMWKGRAVVASATGGIQDQIGDGVHGLLLADPTDLGAYGAAVHRLRKDAALAARLGAQARDRVRADFLGVRHLVEYADLLERIDARPASGAGRAIAGPS